MPARSSRCRGAFIFAATAAPWHGQHCLQNLVPGEGEAKLRGTAEDSGRSALEKGAEAFLLPDEASALSQGGVCRFAFTRLDLETRLYHVAGSREVGCGHAGDGTCSEELENAELFVRGFAEDITFEVIV